MKRVFSIILALTLIVALAVPAFAAKGEFVDSIASKDKPDVIVMTDKNGNKVDGVMKDASGNEVGTIVKENVAITSVADAAAAQPAEGTPAAELVKVYNGLKDGSIKMPKENLVVRDMIDITLDDESAAVLSKDGVSIDMTFDLGVSAVTTVTVMTYNDGAWNEAKAVKNNGDGTVTVTFEHFCPVVFATSGSTTPPAKTGDAMGNSMMLWVAIMAVSAAAAVTLVAIRRQNAAK